MKTFKFLLPVIAFLFCFSFASAQELKAEKYENLEWYNILYLKWEDGKADDAKRIINEYFKPSARDAGIELPVMELDLLYSEWDFMLVFPMEEGLEAFEWKTSPRDVEYVKAFNKRAGGEEKEKKIFEDFSSYIKESKSMLARKHHPLKSFDKDW